MISNLVSHNINIFLWDAVKATGVVFFVFSLSWQLSLVAFMGFLVIMMVSNIYGKYYKVGCGHGRLQSDPSEGVQGPRGASEGLVTQ